MKHKYQSHVAYFEALTVKQLKDIVREKREIINSGKATAVDYFFLLAAMEKLRSNFRINFKISF